MRLPDSTGRPRSNSTWSARRGNVHWGSSIRHLSDMKPSISLMPARCLCHCSTVPFTDRAVRARHGVGAPDDADDQVALAERTGRTRIDDAAERLVPEHKPRLARWRPAVLAFDNLTSVPHTPTAIASTSTDPSRRSGSGMSSRLELPRCVRLDGDGLHVDPSGTLAQAPPATGSRLLENAAAGVEQSRLSSAPVRSRERPSDP